MNLTAEQLRKVVPSISTAKAASLVKVFNNISPQYGLDKPILFNALLANIIHETGEFTIKKESLTYTTAQRIYDVWSSRFTTFQRVKDAAKERGVILKTLPEAKIWYKEKLGGIKAFAEDYVRQPRLLANLTYNGRMGNRLGTDDGYNFVGRSFLQITGRESYEAFRNFKDKTKTVEEIAILIETDDNWGFHAACWEFAVNKKLIPYAEKKDIKTIRLRINGGLIGYSEVVKYYNLANKYITSF